LAEENTGWSETDGTGGLGLPDAEFDYDEFMKKKFGFGAAKPRGISWFWWLVALPLAGLFLHSFLH
jgi:hypothetical protein